MTPRTPVRRRLLALAVVTLAATAACSRGTDEAAGPPTSAVGGPGAGASGVATTSDSPLADPSSIGSAGTDPTGVPDSSATSATAAYAPGPYDAVVLAAGVRQHLQCAGNGPVTVVVVTGLEVAASTWVDLTAPVQSSARVCHYDRPGVGLSPPRTSPQQIVDAGVEARELATLLAVARQSGPYVLVGQGYGALVARAFARQHPAVVRALLLGGDPPAPEGSGLSWTEAGHRVGVAASTAAAGATPVSSATLLVTTEPDDDAATLAADLPGMVQQLTQQ